MNAVLKAIAERRCVRKYESRPVPRDMIEAVIIAGNQAPSAMNSQPWRFVVIDDPDFRNRLVSAAVSQADNFLEPLKVNHPERYGLIRKRFEELTDPIYYSAPVVVFVIGSGPFADMSCPLACENMMLAAHSLGLGSCWVHFGSFAAADPEIKAALDLSPEEKIYGPLIFGYAQGYPEPPTKKPPVVKWI
ncbi:MAG: nitroreductase [Pseudomonadota bacterium]